jgi:two-component system response regulator AtoC
MEYSEKNAFVTGRSLAIQRLNAAVEDIASTNIPVLLMGESGTGKEVYGRLIHRISKDSPTPLKKLSCRALQPGELVARLKSDLGGGKRASKEGPPTLFLDGIDELDVACQTILLSFLPDGEADSNRQSCVRVIASTSRNLEQEVQSGRFRRELYFRINGVCLRLPPLRDRREDVLPLMEHFLAKYSTELGRRIPGLSGEETEFLNQHDWPGNVRELENLARRMVLLGDTEKAISELQETPKLEATPPEDSRSFSLKVVARAASRQAERDLISIALERTHWNRKRAAKELQISYKSLLYKIKQTGLEGKQQGVGAKEQK